METILALLFIMSLFALAAGAAWRVHGYWRAQKGLEGPARTDGPAAADNPAGTTGAAVGADAGALLTTADGTAGARVGVIPAWRCWRLDGTYEGVDLVLRLISYTRLNPWDGPVMVADYPPTPENDSGLYAAKGWQSSILPCHTDAGQLRVLGRVGLYGTVIEGDRGYRAERAVIEELWLLDAQAYIRLFTSKEAALSLEMIEQALAARYAVDVHRGWPDGTLAHRSRSRFWDSA